MPFKLLLVCFIVGALALTGNVAQSDENNHPRTRFNMCREMASYFSQATDAHECWYNPDVDSYAHDIIKRYGYVYESYKVTSKDNYITTLFRIPQGKGKVSSGSGQPVFLLHGLASSSHSMLDIGRRSLAFILADAGFDVWLGNLRGSAYSVGHTNLSYINLDYWKFSFHEMGVYDLPANLEFVAKKTGRKDIIFIGHSISASVFHVFESFHRDLAKKILKVAILVAPVVYLTDIHPIHKNLARFGNPLMVFATLLGVNSNSTFAERILNSTNELCNNMPPMLSACQNGFYLAFGLNSKEIPPYHIPPLLAHNPSGFSINTINHLIQMAHNDGVFQEFDYGVRENQKIYDDVFPPEYDVQDCATPVFVFYGAGDWLSNEKDVQKLLNTIPKNKVKGTYKIHSNKWEHMDYFYGKRAEKLFYSPLLHTLKDFEDKTSSRKSTSATTPSRQTTSVTTPASKSTESYSDLPDTSVAETSNEIATVSGTNPTTPSESIETTTQAVSSGTNPPLFKQ